MPGTLLSLDFCGVLGLPDEIHCFKSGAEGLQFLCLVPLGEATEGH